MKMATSKSSDSKPFAAALRLLTRRDRSVAELRQKLMQFGFSDSAVNETVERCQVCNYLDDKRYALERARTQLRNGRGVGRKILLDLQRRGIDEETAETALSAASEEFPTKELLREQLERRFPNFDYRSADERQRRRVVGFFQRRGFNLDEIFSNLKQNSE